MAEIDFSGYRSGGGLSTGYIAKPRTLEVYVDFTETANQTAGATDSINLFELPKGTVVLSAGLEQITAGSSGNTLVARVGTVTYSGTLASDATAGTITAHADVSGGHPGQLAAAADFNLLSASAVRADGVVRAWVVVQEANRATGKPKAAARDTSTGLS